jgi:hypothetical protein
MCEWNKNASIVTKTSRTFPQNISPSGLCSICILCGKCEVGKKAKEGRTLFPVPFGTAQFGAEKKLPSLNDIQIVPELFGEQIIFRNVKTETEVGGFKSKLPLAIAAMGSTKVAHSRGKVLSEGAALAGIPAIIGENVYPTYGEDGLKERINAFLESWDKKYGAIIVQVNVEDRKIGTFEKALELGAMGIEIKLGQGAKQGLGGEIQFEGKELAKKYRELGYMVIEREEGKFERHSSPGSIKENELREMLIKYSEFNVPIWVKVGMGRGIHQLIQVLNKIKKEQNVLLECLTIDGYGGGTGMSPWLIMNEVGLPSFYVFSREFDVNFDILLAGGYINGVDITKAMMLGASGAAMGRAFLIAAQEGANCIKNFVSAVKEEIQMVCAMLRINDVKSLIGKKENLFPLTNEIAKILGLKQEI